MFQECFVITGIRVCEGGGNRKRRNVLMNEFPEWECLLLRLISQSQVNLKSHFIVQQQQIWKCYFQKKKNLKMLLLIFILFYKQKKLFFLFLSNIGKQFLLVTQSGKIKYYNMFFQVDINRRQKIILNAITTQCLLFSCYLAI